MYTSSLYCLLCDGYQFYILSIGGAKWQRWKSSVEVIIGNFNNYLSMQWHECWQWYWWLYPCIYIRRYCFCRRWSLTHGDILEENLLDNDELLPLYTYQWLDLHYVLSSTSTNVSALLLHHPLANILVSTVYIKSYNIWCPLRGRVNSHKSLSVKEIRNRPFY